MVFGHNRLRRFRTPPAEDERRAFQLALFSCHMPYHVSGLFRKRTDLANLDMWDFLGRSLRRHEDEVDLVIAGGDQCYTDGVPTLDIWKKLNGAMRREGEHLLPDEDSLRSWYRDIYRGYWGFEGVRRVFDSFPTYMMWDDHEIGDGWGSHYLADGGPDDGLARVFPDLEERGLSRDDGRELARRMFRAASATYLEYQHSHNPDTTEGFGTIPSSVAGRRSTRWTGAATATSSGTASGSWEGRSSSGLLAGQSPWTPRTRRSCSSCPRYRCSMHEPRW